MDYKATRANVYTKISASGVTISLRVVTLATGSFNYATETYSSYSTTYNTFAILSNCKEEDFGDQVRVGDKTFLIPSLGIPQLNELGENSSYKIICKSKTWTPVAELTIEPGGLILMYKVMARS
jgi:hypothetical protein